MLEAQIKFGRVSEYILKSWDNTSELEHFLYAALRGRQEALFHQIAQDYIGLAFEIKRWVVTALRVHSQKMLEDLFRMEQDDPYKDMIIAAFEYGRADLAVIWCQKSSCDRQWLAHGTLLTTPFDPSIFQDNPKMVIKSSWFGSVEAARQIRSPSVMTKFRLMEILEYLHSTGYVAKLDANKIVQSRISNRNCKDLWYLCGNLQGLL